MKCPTCGFENDETTESKCVYCGTPLSDDGHEGASGDEPVSHDAAWSKSSSQATGEQPDETSASYQVGALFGSLASAAKEAKRAATPHLEELKHEAQSTARELANEAAQAASRVSQEVADAVDEARHEAEMEAARPPRGVPFVPQKPQPNKKLIALGASVALLACIVLMCVMLGSGEESSHSVRPTNGGERPVPTYELTVKVTCNENLMFSTYDLEVSLDNHTIGTVTHGTENEFYETIEAGTHTLELENDDDYEVNGTRNFTVAEEDSVLVCTASCKSDRVVIDSFDVMSKDEYEQSLADDADDNDESSDGDDEPESSDGTETDESSDDEDGDGGAESADESVDEALTVDTCADLKAVLASKSDADYASFASRYAGRTIEFDASIDNVMLHGDYKTRWDFLLSAGDYSATHQVGPSFKFEDCGRYDLHLPASVEGLSEGDNVHIVAKVLEYDADRCLFFLDPVSVDVR